MTVEEICPEFPEWPRHWKGVQADEVYGQELLAVMRPFVDRLVASGLSKNTIRRHLDNLWLLGGEIIRAVNTAGSYRVSPREELLKAIGPDGGPSCRHLDTQAAQRSFDATCRQLYAYMSTGGSSSLRAPGSRV
jgi:hypothetical protein